MKFKCVQLTSPSFSSSAFTVIDETDHLLVINKAAGWLTHPSHPDHPRTVWDELRMLLCYEQVNGGKIGLVNRLDRETSGLILIAKHREAARYCMMAMQQRKIQKIYRAFVWGWPDEDAFTIAQPIIQSSKLAVPPHDASCVEIKRQVHETGAPSLTHFTVLARRIKAVREDSAPHAVPAEFQANLALAVIANDSKSLIQTAQPMQMHPPLKGVQSLRYSELRVQPLTGRTHQIRVHSSYAGFPIVGDKLYGPDEAWYLHFITHGWTDAMQTALWLPRQALHAETLELDFQGKHYHWSAPLPEDLEQLTRES